MGAFLSNPEQAHIFNGNNANVPNVIWQFNIYCCITFVEGTAQRGKECDDSDSMQKFWHWLSLSNWSLWKGEDHFEKCLAFVKPECKWCHPLRMMLRGSGTLLCGCWLQYSHYHYDNCHKLGVLSHGVVGSVWDVLPRRNGARRASDRSALFSSPRIYCLLELIVMILIVVTHRAKKLGLNDLRKYSWQIFLKIRHFI